MNFLKKNILLFSVLLVGLGIASFFIIKVISETHEMAKAAEQVKDLKKKITDLNKQSPIPSKANYDKISKDALVIKEKTKKIQQIFGKPYTEAVKSLAKGLGMTSDELIKKWRETYKLESDKGSPREFIFNKFFATFDQPKVEKAVQAFADKISETSVEPLNQANIDGCIMEALGVPRKMESIPCKKYMLDMQDNLIKYMKNAEKDDEEPFLFGDTSKGTNVEKLTFDKFEGASLPRPDEVSYIFKHLKLIEDLLFRIKKAKIKSLDAISKESLQGVTKSDYMIFTYNITVSAPINNVRKFMNSLLEAYKDNRVYVIKSMTLTSKEDVKGIVNSDSKAKDEDKRIRRDRSRMDMNLMDGEEEVQETSKSGVPIIGINQTVTADIKFQYIIYIGDELTET
jgi:hypothetical protein